jgi:hypothetical protein
MWEQNHYDNFVTQTKYSEAWQIHGIKKLTVSQLREPEAEILDVVGKKFGAFLLVIHINIACCAAEAIFCCPTEKKKIAITLSPNYYQKM